MLATYESADIAAHGVSPQPQGTEQSHVAPESLTDPTTGNPSNFTKPAPSPAVNAAPPPQEEGKGSSAKSPTPATPPADSPSAQNENDDFVEVTQEDLPQSDPPPKPPSEANKDQDQKNSQIPPGGNTGNPAVPESKTVDADADQVRRLRFCQ
jgi:hypothetical protein